MKINKYVNIGLYIFLLNLLSIQLSSQEIDYTHDPINIGGNDHEVEHRPEVNNTSRLFEIHPPDIEIITGNRDVRPGGSYLSENGNTYIVDRKGNVLRDYNKTIVDHMDGYSYRGGAKVVGNWYYQHGKGKITWANESYEGSLDMNKRHGKGVHKYSFGRIASKTGTFRNDKFIEGTVKYKSGDVYKGEWFDGRHGSGDYFSNNFKCSGLWVNNKFTHFGTVELSNGATYIGVWNGVSKMKGHFAFRKDMKIGGERIDSKWESYYNLYDKLGENTLAQYSLAVHSFDLIDEAFRTDKQLASSYNKLEAKILLKSILTEQMIYSEFLESVYNRISSLDEISKYQKRLRSFAAQELSELNNHLAEFNSAWTLENFGDYVENTHGYSVQRAQNFYEVIQEYAPGTIRFHNSNQSVDINSPNTTGVFVIGRSLDLPGIINNVSTHTYLALSVKGKVTTFGGYKNSTGYLELKRNNLKDNYINPKTGEYWDNVEVVEITPPEGVTKTSFVNRLNSKISSFEKESNKKGDKQYSVLATLYKDPNTANCHTTVKDILDLEDPSLKTQLIKMNWKGIDPFKRTGSEVIFKYFNVFGNDINE